MQRVVFGLRRGLQSALLLAGSVVVSGALGCSLSSVDTDPLRANLQAENNPAFHARLLELASTYQSFARVDDELHWAPFLCRQPMPSGPRRSMSTMEDTHGRKLYFVFAQDRAAYLGRDGKSPAFEGQAVIKEAWTVQEVPADTAYNKTQSPVMYLPEGGKLFHAKDRAGLFIMYRLPTGTPGTDGGWVYGTVDATGTSVTSAGTVPACMSCHKQAKFERLFGIDYHGA